MATFTFDGRSVHFVDEGQGEQAVVFVHGFPFQWSMWEPTIPVAVECGFRAVALDLPGFGRSEPLGERSECSIDRFADVVAALIGDLGLRPVVLVGLSMGGYIALSVARRHATVLSGLVLADTRADPDTPEGRQARTDQQAVVEGKGEVAPLVDGLLARILSESSPRYPEAKTLLADMMHATSPATWIGALEAMKDRRDQTDLLPSITVPTLVVVGDSDALVPVEVAEGMAGAIPAGRLAVVPRAGHVANLENPDDFNRVLAEFLSTVPKPS